MAGDQTYTFKALAEEVLKTASAPMTPEEIWADATKKNLPSKLSSVGKTPARTLYSELHKATLKAGSPFDRVGSEPRRFWLARRGNPPTAPVPETAPPTTKTSSLLERDLHPLLAWFASDKMEGLHVKTIHHELSKKSGFGEWVHPDIVGVLFPESAGEQERARKLATAINAPLCRLYSFELKLRVDFGNLRESFFQCVSNSSWAHEGYLVAAAFDESPEFDDELERLCGTFGIGAIELSTEDPKDSEVKILARSRELNWPTIDKLVEMNSDFANFVRDVTCDLGTMIHEQEYDKVPADPAKYLDDVRAGKRK